MGFKNFILVVNCPHPSRLPPFPFFNNCPPFQPHLLSVIFLDLFEIGPQVHGDLVLGAQEGLHHGVSRQSDTTKSWTLKLTPQVKDLLIQVLDLRWRQKTFQCVL